MGSLENEIIRKQANIIGTLTTSNIELETKLHQALLTAELLAKELEEIKGGNSETTEESVNADTEGLTDCNTERV